MKSKLLSKGFLLFPFLAFIFIPLPTGNYSQQPAPIYYSLATMDQSRYYDADHDDLCRDRGYWKLYIPDWFGKIMASHMDVMYSAGNFEKFQPKDLDHCHLLLKNDAKAAYGSFDELLRDVAVILYHTREGSGLWQRQEALGIPAEQRTQRSILGFMDGKCFPVKDVIDIKIFDSGFYRENYELAGTISDTGISWALGLLMTNSSICMPVNGEVYYPGELMLNIKPGNKGRYVSGGQKYDIFLRIFKNDRRLVKNSESR